MTAMTQSAMLEPFLIISSAATDVGKVRAVNEDSVLNRADAGLWVVADGMGGHQRGDFASTLITRTLRNMPAPGGGAALMAQVRNALTTVNRQLLDQRRSDHDIIASTVVCLLIAEGNFACVWAGDSRLYLCRHGRLSRISSDHSIVQELLDAGAITQEQAVRHPRGNEVTRAVGAAETLRLDIRQGRISPQDYFLLCSDGLTRVMEDDEIATRLIGDPATIAKDMIAAALERGAPDNVTVAIICCMSSPPDDFDPEETMVINRHTLNTGRHE